MYTKFFGLSAKPFELLPNPRFIYLSKVHSKALSYLQYGIQERAGFTLLTGEVGSGKTTLIRDIINKGCANASLAMIFNTQVDTQQLVAMINEDFGLDSSGKNKTELLRELNDFLVAECSAGRQPILIIDEAQNLSVEALEEVRLLSNLEAEEFKLMQIILVGQPELKRIISLPELRQLRQRISLSCHLSPLNREETEEYIFHRLGTVGRPDCVTFEAGTIDLIFEFSGGVPRLINVICDFLLVAAFVEETRAISLGLVAEAVTELSFEETDSIEVASLASSLASVNHEDHLLQGQEYHNKLNAEYLEKESIHERLSGQGDILKYLINQQHKQFDHFEERIEDLSIQLADLQRGLEQLEIPASSSQKLLLENKKSGSL